MSQQDLPTNTPDATTTHLRLVGDEIDRRAAARGAERRRFRRHDLCQPQLVIDRWDEASSGVGPVIGELIDLSASGVRVRTADGGIKPGQTLAIRLSLPKHAGITPFVRAADAGELRPACEWTGHLTVMRRVERMDGSIELGGRLLGMDEAVRGMLSLYLSIQPLAA